MPNIVRGSCQVCEKVHKINEHGVLAKHGYRVRFGFFEGVCPGSGEKPYELSCEFLRKHIVNVSQGIEKLNIVLETLSENTTESYLRLYSNGHHHWSKGQVVEVDGDFYFDNGSSRVCLRTYQVYAQSVVDAVKILNKIKSKSVAQQIRQTSRYIEYQQKRVDLWGTVKGAER